MSVIEEKRLHAQRVAKKCAAIVREQVTHYDRLDGVVRDGRDQSHHVLACAAIAIETFWSDDAIVQRLMTALLEDEPNDG